jgi:hypothetical protein
MAKAIRVELEANIFVDLYEKARLNDSREENGRPLKATVTSTYEKRMTTQAKIVRRERKMRWHQHLPVTPLRYIIQRDYESTARGPRRDRARNLTPGRAASSFVMK